MVELGDSEDSPLNTNLRQKLDNVGQGLGIRFYLSPQKKFNMMMTFILAILSSIQIMLFVNFFPGGGGGLYF